MQKFTIFDFFLQFQVERNVYVETIKSLLGQSNVSLAALTFYIMHKTQLNMSEKERAEYLSKVDYLRRKLKVSPTICCFLSSDHTKLITCRLHSLTVCFFIPLTVRQLFYLGNFYWKSPELGIPPYTVRLDFLQLMCQ